MKNGKFYRQMRSFLLPLHSRLLKHIAKPVTTVETLPILQNFALNIRKRSNPKCVEISTALQNLTVTDNNKCPFGRRHKCQRCNKWGCRAVRHSDNGQSSSSRTSPPSEDLNSLKQQLVVLSTRLDNFCSTEHLKAYFCQRRLTTQCIIFTRNCVSSL